MLPNALHKCDSLPETLRHQLELRKFTIILHSISWKPPSQTHMAYPHQTTKARHIGAPLKQVHWGPKENSYET